MACVLHLLGSNPPCDAVFQDRKSSGPRHVNCETEEGCVCCEHPSFVATGGNHKVWDVQATTILHLLLNHLSAGSLTLCPDMEYSILGAFNYQQLLDSQLRCCFHSPTQNVSKTPLGFSLQ